MIVNSKLALTWKIGEELARFNEKLCFHCKKRNKKFLRFERINLLNPNSDLSSISHCNIKSLSVREVMRIENMITQVKFS